MEKPTGVSGHQAGGTCSDCGAPVTNRFCGACGQPTHVHRSLLHLGEELLHGVMHFDARIWRTLPLLAFYPGRLTREWVQGRRTRYVSPLALFLFTVFLMFFILSFTGGEGPAPTAPLPEQVVATETALAEARTALTQIEADLAAEPDAPGSAAVLTGARQMVTSLERQLASQKALQAGQGRPDGLTPGSWQANLKDMTADAKLTSDKSGMGKKLLKKLQNPDLAFYKLQQTLYKYAFLLVPLSIPFMGLLFLWKRGFTFYDHGVFVLYSLTFIAILSMAVVGLFALNAVLGGIALTAACLWVPVHMYFQLKGAYSLRVFSALWRAFVLLNFCSFVVGLFGAVVVYLGLGL